jgi:hypothetical protein
VDGGGVGVHVDELALAGRLLGEALGDLGARDPQHVGAPLAARQHVGHHRERARRPVVVLRCGAQEHREAALLLEGDLERRHLVPHPQRVADPQQLVG